MFRKKWNHYNVRKEFLKQEEKEENHDLETQIRICRFGMGCSFGFSFGSSNSHSMTTSVSRGPSNCILMHVNKDTYHNIWNSTADANRESFLINQQQLNQQQFNQQFNQQSSESDQVQSNQKLYHSPVLSPGYQETKTSPSLFVLKDLKEPSSKLLRIGWVLRTLILTRSPGLMKGIRTSRHNSMTPSGQSEPSNAHAWNNPVYMVGSELVDWLMNVSSQTPVRVHSRSQAVSMLQVLLEDNVLLPFDYSLFTLSDDPDDSRGTLTDRASFLDAHDSFYRWFFHADGRISNMDPDPIERVLASQEFASSLEFLIKSITECNLRSVFKKSPKDRTNDDITLIFDEMMTIKALSDLNHAMKRELARVICYEHHSKKGEIVFNQGDPGFWWYLIYRGSVHVDIVGKGIVDTIHSGGDFGKLALVNHAPRAATIIVAEENTQFFKVHKDDFDRILSDVEANMIRLHEHGKNVLVLLKLNVNKNRAIQMSKISTSSSAQNQTSTPSMLSAPSVRSSNQSGSQEQSKFVVIQGTREKMIDYCLENKFDNNWNPSLFLSDDEQGSAEEEPSDHASTSSDPNVPRSRSSSLFAAYLDLMSKDTYFQDLISTHVIYMSTATICNYLEQYYYIEHQLNQSVISNQSLISNQSIISNHSDNDNESKNSYQQKMAAAYTPDDIDHIIKHKKRVIRFVYSWKLVIGFELFFTDGVIGDFLIKIHDQVIKDATFYGNDCLTEEVNLTHALMQEKSFFDMSTRLKGKKIKANLTGAIHVQDKQSDFDPPSCSDATMLSDLMRRPSSAAPSMSPSPCTSPRRQLPRYPGVNALAQSQSFAPSLMVNDVTLQSPQSQYGPSLQGSVSNNQVNNKPKFNNLQLNQTSNQQLSSSTPSSPRDSFHHRENHSRSASPSSPSQAALNVASSFVGFLTQGGTKGKSVKNSPKNFPKNSLPGNSPSKVNAINDAGGFKPTNSSCDQQEQFNHSTNVHSASTNIASINIASTNIASHNIKSNNLYPRPSSASSGYISTGSNFMNDLSSSNYTSSSSGVGIASTNLASTKLASNNIASNACTPPVKLSPASSSIQSSSIHGLSSSASFSPTFLPSSSPSSFPSSVSSSFPFNPAFHLLLTQRQSSASSSSQIQIEQGKQYYFDSMDSGSKDGSMVTTGKIFFPDPITDRDDVINRIYCADHTYTTLRCSVTKNASYIKKLAADKLGLNVPAETLILAEVTSSGERNPFPDHEINIGTGISVNGRIFITINHHLDALTPLPEQDGPTIGTYTVLEDFSAHDLAHALTYHSWQLFINVHERELIYQVFGRDKFDKVTSNLDLLLRHFEEVRFWVTTELILCNNLAKRVNLLRKFIKTAAICKEYQNVHTFFAIIIGLSDVAVTRLAQTWSKLPEKLRKSFSEYESLIDPTKNHRNYRILMTDIKPPVIPFTPILLKDLSFAHHGNQTFVGDLINFEKMQMLAQAMRTFKFCRSKPLSMIESQIISDPSTEASQTILSKKNGPKVEAYVKNLRVIDNQKLLIQLSKKIERNHDNNEKQ